MSDERFQQLAARAAHEIEGTGAIADIEIDVTHTEDCGTLVDSVRMYSQIMPHYYTSKPALSILSSVHSMQIDRVDELIALLQEARRVMADQGGV